MVFNGQFMVPYIDLKPDKPSGMILLREDRVDRLQRYRYDCKNALMINYGFHRPIWRLHSFPKDGKTTDIIHDHKGRTIGTHFSSGLL